MWRHCTDEIRSYIFPLYFLDFLFLCVSVCIPFFLFLFLHFLCGALNWADTPSESRDFDVHPFVCVCTASSRSFFPFFTPKKRLQILAFGSVVCQLPQEKDAPLGLSFHYISIFSIFVFFCWRDLFVCSSRLLFDVVSIEKRFVWQRETCFLCDGWLKKLATFFVHMDLDVLRWLCRDARYSNWNHNDPSCRTIVVCFKRISANQELKTRVFITFILIGLSFCKEK